MSNDQINPTPQDDDTDADPVDAVFDKAAIEADIAAGAKAFKELRDHADKDWSRWETTIIGFRGLRTLAFHKSATSDVLAYAYRQEMSHLLRLRKYEIYDSLTKQERSSCYKLMDHIEDISVWYAELKDSDKRRWKHPDTIVKQCPKHMISGGLRHNIKAAMKKTSSKKPAVSAETERLRQLLIFVIKQLAEFKPDAIKYLELVNPPDAPSDNVEDLFVSDSDDDDEEEKEAEA